MRLHQSQGCSLGFNLHVVTIVGCSVSEDGQKMENHSAKALLWISPYVSEEVKGKRVWISLLQQTWFVSWPHRCDTDINVCLL